MEKTLPKNAFLPTKAKISLIQIFLLFALTGFTPAHRATDQENLDRKISFSLEKEKIKTILRTIEKAADVRFTYSPQLIPTDQRISFTAKDESLETVLTRLLRPLDVGYKIMGRNIVLNRRSLTQPITTDTPPDNATASLKISLSSPTIKPLQLISGTVTDENNNGLPGVSVVVKGTQTGTTTDVDGRFQLNAADPAAVLVFSFVGYLTQEITVGNQTQINVSMQGDTKSLDEVIVVGYGTQKKASVVGSIVQVSGEKLKASGGVTNLAQALTGQLPGVATLQTSGEPGADDPTLFIRGRGTWNSAQPLVLVDGIERRMNDIDMSEVENVSVLKDASATAVYGVKGAEGVVLITTKKGTIGKPKITVESNFTTKTLSRVPQKLNSYDQFQFRNEVIEYQLNYGLSGQETYWKEYLPQQVLQNYRHPQAPGLEYIFPDVNWSREITNPFPLSNRVNVNISGGTKFARYFASVSRTFDDDLIRSGQNPIDFGYKSKNTYERINFRTNLDLNITPTTTLTTRVAGWVGNKHQAFGSDDASLDIFRAYAEISPDLFPTYQADGSYGYNPDNRAGNPFEAANSRGLGESRRTNVTTDFVLLQELDFLSKGLSLRGSLSYDNNFFTQGGIQDGGQARNLYISPAIIDIKEGERPEDYMQGYINIQNPNHDYDWVKGVPVQVAESSSGAGQSSRRLFYQLQMNYARTFGKHDLTGLALLNREKFAQGSMFPRYREDWVGRVTYGYDNRYFFESNFAYNGSEKFGPGYRFGFFPSVAVGWNLAAEPFMNASWLDNLKIRYSLGKVGNDNFNSPRWAYQTNWSLETARTNFGYPQASQSPYYQYTEQVIGNPNLSWETSVKQNIGLDVAVFSNKIGLTLDLFQDHRRDVFLNAAQRTLAPYFGQNPVAANLGEVMIKGYEIELTHRNTLSNRLSYNLSISHTGAFDKIVYMEDPPLLPGYQKNAGYSIGQRRVQLPAGFLNNWDDVYSSPAYQANNGSKLPGDYRILDFNADGGLSALDNAPWSYPIDRPQHTYNLSLGADYRGFSASVQFYGVYNILREYTGYIRVPFYNTIASGPVITEHLDMWTPENPEGRYRHQRIDYQGNPGYANVQYEDGSYLRFRTAEIAYLIKDGFLHRIGASSLRIFLNGNNLHFWSKMIEDREARGDDTVNTLYPMTKRFNLGATIQF